MTLQPDKHRTHSCPLDRIADKTSGIGREIAALAIILMMVLVALNTLARVIPSVNGLYFVEEYTGYLFVTVTFMGLADTFRSGGHVRVEFLTRHLATRPAAALEILVTLVAIGVISILAWYAAALLGSSISSGERAQTVTQTPLWIPRLFLLPGYCLLLIELLANLKRNIQILCRGTATVRAPAAKEV